jgi:hypothetical protein
MKRNFLAIAAVLLLATAAATAADFPEAANKPFQFELGTAWDSFDTQAGLDYSRNGLISAGTRIDFENLLDIPVMNTHFKGVGQWRFSQVSYVQVGYENVNREGQRILSDQIVWGDTTYGAGGLLDGKFKSTEVYLGYRYDAFKADNVRLGTTIGFSVWSLKTSLSGEGQVTGTDGTVLTGIFEKAVSVKAPVPVIGLVGEGAISSHFVFGFYARALFIRLSDISGGEVQGGLNLKWYLNDTFGLVGGVDITSLQIKKYVQGNVTFAGQYVYTGPRLAVSASF